MVNRKYNAAFFSSIPLKINNQIVEFVDKTCYATQVECPLPVLIAENIIRLFNEKSIETVIDKSGSLEIAQG